MAGDEDLPLLHFKKHYRIHYPMITDYLDQRRHFIRVQGIASVAVFDGDGVCIFNQPMIPENLGDFEEVIDGALKKIKGPNLKKSAYVENGTIYAKAVKKEDGTIVHERMPQLAAGPEGSLYQVYCSDKSGTNDVFLRIAVKGKWGKDIPIAATKDDEYAPTVAALGEDEVMVAYVSGGKKRYDIYTAKVKGGKASKGKALTRSKDDAMAPSLCRNDEGKLWLTWYEWAKMGDLSRDREIFVSRNSGSGWSKPVQVSPRDVPNYEDHSDPVIRGDGKGGAWVAWAWDYHGTLKSKPPVEENSIFLCHVDSKMKPSDPLAAGWRGEGMARDYVPTLAVGADGKPWVAWDNSHKASTGYSDKAIFVNHLSSDDFDEQVEAATHSDAIDSPRLAGGPEGRLCLVWGQKTMKGWEIWSRDLSEEGMKKPKKLKVKGKQPRYPFPCFDGEGNLWLAYTDTSSKKWKVRVDKVD